MSVSTPIRTSSSRVASFLARSKQLPFWGISVAVHAVVLGTLIVVFPVREIVFTRDAPQDHEIITRGDELQEIVEAIRDRTAERLRARVALLEQGQDRMAQNFQIINAHFQPFADQQRATARARLDEYVRQALDKQQALVAALRAAQASRDPLPALEAARVAMPRILTAQDEIRRGIMLLDLQKDALATQQNAAQEAQINANQHIRWLDDAVLDIQRRDAPLKTLTQQLKNLDRDLPALEAAARASFAAATNADALVRLCEQQRKDTDRLIRNAQDATRKLKDRQDTLARVLRDAHQQANRRTNAKPDPAKLNALQRDSDAVLAVQKQAKTNLDELKRRESALKITQGTLEKTAAHTKITAAQNRNAYWNSLRDVVNMRRQAVQHEIDLAQALTNRATFLVTSCNIQFGAYAAQQRIANAIHRLLAEGTNGTAAARDTVRP